MRFAAIVHCSKCKQPIVSGEGFGFVCFKIPGKEGYLFFHCRVRAGDCWEAYLKGDEPLKKRGFPGLFGSMLKVLVSAAE